MCVSFVCVYLCKHDMIRAALETSHLKREILFLTRTMWSMVIIVIWPLFKKKIVNKKPLNRIGIFWYHFTPRKIPYFMVSFNLVKFGSHGLWVTPHSAIPKGTTVVAERIRVQGLSYPLHQDDIRQFLFGSDHSKQTDKILIHRIPF